jgi:hypothetical protein
MSSFMTRWSVLVEQPVAAGDRDPQGGISDAAVARWVEGACASYLDQCAQLRSRARDQGITIRLDVGASPPGAVFGQASTVVVSASATEVFPTSFVVAVRLRALDGTDGSPGNATCTVTLVDPDGVAQDIDAPVRDELIALEHAAHHFN